METALHTYISDYKLNDQYLLDSLLQLEIMNQKQTIKGNERGAFTARAFCYGRIYFRRIVVGKT